MLTWILVALLALASPFLLGLLLGLAACLGPGVEWKVKVGRSLAEFQAKAAGLSRSDQLVAAKEMEWLVRRRFPGKVPPELYDALLKRLPKE